MESEIEVDMADDKCLEEELFFEKTVKKTICPIDETCLKWYYFADR